MVHAHTKLVQVRGQRLRAYELRSAIVRVRIKRKQILGNRINARQGVEWNSLRRRIRRNKEIKKLPSLHIDPRAVSQNAISVVIEEASFGLPLRNILRTQLTE